MRCKSVSCNDRIYEDIFNIIFLSLKHRLRYFPVFWYISPQFSSYLRKFDIHLFSPAKLPRLYGADAQFKLLHKLLQKLLVKLLVKPLVKLLVKLMTTLLFTLID